MGTLDARVAVIYYSSTGTIHQLARAFAEGASRQGADVRLWRVAELAPDEAIDRNPGWRRHLDKTSDIALATHEDLEWANGYAFGTPTRFGNVSAQLRQFFDTTAGLWQRDVFANKPATGFTSSYRAHGGQESTLLSLYNTLYHWGTLILPRGYVDNDLIERTGGNPYGVSVSLERAEREPELFAAVLDAARFRGGRLATLASILAPTPGRGRVTRGRMRRGRMRRGRMRRGRMRRGRMNARGFAAIDQWHVASPKPDHTDPE